MLIESPTMRQSFGETVRRLRENLRLTQHQLAARADVSRPTNQNLERLADVPKLHNRNVRKLAEALELTPEQLDAEWKGEERAVMLPAKLVAWIEEEEANGKPAGEWITWRFRLWRRFTALRRRTKQRT